MADDSWKVCALRIDEVLVLHGRKVTDLMDLILMQVKRVLFPRLISEL